MENQDDLNHKAQRFFGLIFYARFIMSHMYLIITQNKIDFLPKERYLKFDEYGYINGLFIYIRYDYSLNMIDLLDDEYYFISSSGKKLLEKILSSSNYLYWSAVQLENNVGEEISIKYLNLIKNRKFTKILTLNNGKFHINTLYHIE